MSYIPQNAVQFLIKVRWNNQHSVWPTLHWHSCVHPDCFLLALIMSITVYCDWIIAQQCFLNMWCFTAVFSAVTMLLHPHSQGNIWLFEDSVLITGKLPGKFAAVRNSVPYFILFNSLHFSNSTWPHSCLDSYYRQLFTTKSQVPQEPPHHRRQR